MKLKLPVILLFVGIYLLLYSCTTTKDILPEGNVSKLNTPANDIAPVSMPGNSGCAPCSREFASKKQDEDFGIMPSSYFLRQLLGDRLAQDAEAITFLTDSTGFFSIAHPPDKTAAEALDVPLSGTIGGTDIFEFRKENGKYIFRNLGDSINTLTWDSHPVAVQDENCNVLLVWSSDRTSSKGYSSPFSYLQRLNGTGEAYSGNSDLYYAFRINGVWTEPKNFAEAGSSINTTKNEETPFLHCLCHQPYLFFSSNRDGDYDIYYAKLSVDFDSKTISVIEEARPLPRNEKNGINTKAKEYFPFIPAPVSPNPGENYIYFSSNRYNEPFMINEEKKERLKNVGNFDIYRFKLPENITCTPPKITYKVKIIDMTNPGAEVLSPFITIFPASGAAPITKNTNPAVFDLIAGEKYTAAGGSLYDKIECEKGVERTISNYTYRKITKLDPLILKKDTTIEYMEIVERGGKVSFDTVRSVITMKASELSRLESGSDKKIESIVVKGDSLEISIQQVTKKFQDAGLDTIRKTRKVPLEYVVQKYDTSYIKINSLSPSRSEKTARSEIIGVKKAKEEVVIEDTIYVVPQYYYFPPCEWKYVHDNVDYRRNVPYFQTGFWEVNTVQNLNRHINELKSKEFADASFIELSPKNIYFGYNRGDLTPEKQEVRRRKYDSRVSDYRKFAKAVDENLDKMADEMAEHIIPAFENLDSRGSGAQNKLIILIYGFSDIRPIQKGTFISDKPINYMEASYDTVSNAIRNIVPVNISANASLVGVDNDLLSKLRTYFGYMEVVNRLKKHIEFKKYIESGEVLFPDQYQTRAQFEKKFTDAKIVFLLEGRRIDPKQYKVAGYVGEEGDFESLDPIRRINIIIKRVEVVGGIIKEPDCCRPADSPVTSTKSKGELGK